MAEEIIVPPEIKKIERGLKETLSKKKLFELNFPNYDLRDIVISEMTMDVSPYSPDINGNLALIKGSIDFSGSSFPEAQWEHIPANLLLTVINQGGKASQAHACSKKGIALRQIKKAKIAEPAPFTDLTFEFDSKTFVHEQIRRGEKIEMLFVDSEWRFLHKGRKFAYYELRSIGVNRDYSNLEARKEKPKRIGEILVAAYVLTPWQCRELLKKQQHLITNGNTIRLGELAVEEGYCSKELVEQCVQ